MSQNQEKKSFSKTILGILLAILVLAGGGTGYLLGDEPDEAPVQNHDAIEQQESVSQTPDTGAGQDAAEENAGQDTTDLVFRNSSLRNSHYEKHGVEMGFASAEEYEKAAAAVAANPKALHKVEKEDGDDVYYVEDTNEFVVVSTDGYIRTYFCPDSGIRYFERQ